MAEVWESCGEDAGARRCSWRVAHFAQAEVWGSRCDCTERYRGSRLERYDTPT